MVESHHAVDSDLYPSRADTPSISSAVSWSAITAGTVAAIALTLVLLALGSAFGLASVSPWPGVGATLNTFTIGAGVWMVVTQWLSAMLGGYIAGRLRVRWHGLHTDEVFFRDTAHGFITWAAATVLITVVAVLATILSAPAAPPIEAAVSAEAADAVRKATATFAGFTGLSLVIGAFVGSVSGVIGGRLRDKHP